MKAQDTHMIDVTSKQDTERLATARAIITMRKETIKLIREGQIPKGDVLPVAQTAGILAAKRTPDLLPLCHPLLLTGVTIDFKIASKGNYIEITSTVKGKGKTGFEMEALTAVSIAALTVYDMCKIVDKGIVISEIKLLKKTGGKSGTYILKE
jgi:cyclic pyranopterin monophosphate synthase